MQNSKSPVKLFITGASGYVGGSILTELLKQSEKYDITVLTRSEAHVAKFKELGVSTIIGSLDSEEILVKAASEADAVLNLADADNLAAVQHLMKGLKSSRRAKKIFIHTSGSAIVADMARGEYASDKIFSDTNMDEIHAIPLAFPRRGVDNYIFENSEGLETMIVCPPTIYGVGTGPFNRLSQQVPGLMKAFLGFGYAATIGNGSNIWSHVHIEDLASFYVLLLDKALAGQAVTGRDGFYFLESGEHAWKDVVVKIAEELHKRGAIKQAEVGRYTTEEVDKFFGMMGWIGIGSNSRVKAEKARKLGWKPKSGRMSIIESVGKEVDVLLAATKAGAEPEQVAEKPKGSAICAWYRKIFGKKQQQCA